MKSVEPFNGESLTSENMFRMILQLLEEYNLVSNTNVGLRDNVSANYFWGRLQTVNT